MKEVKTVNTTSGVTHQLSRREVWAKRSRASGTSTRGILGLSRRLARGVYSAAAKFLHSAEDSSDEPGERAVRGGVGNRRGRIRARLSCARARHRARGRLQGAQGGPPHPPGNRRALPPRG